MKQSHSAVFRSVAVEPLAEGILSGLSFMVKDVFAVKGHTNSAGNPSWLSSHTPGLSSMPRQCSSFCSKGRSCRR